MKAKTTLILLMTGVLIGASVAAVYAGGGGLGGPGGTIFLQCYSVQEGPNPPQVLTVDDQFINPTVEKVGKLKMICTFPTVTLADNSVGLNLSPFEANHFTCYEAPPAANASAVVSYVDTFFDTTQTVKVNGPSKFICVQAEKTCVKGCPGITPP